MCLSWYHNGLIMGLNNHKTWSFWEHVLTQKYAMIIRVVGQVQNTVLDGKLVIYRTSHPVSSVLATNLHWEGNSQRHLKYFKDCFNDKVKMVLCCKNMKNNVRYFLEIVDFIHVYFRQFSQMKFRLYIAQSYIILNFKNLHPTKS